MTDLDWVFLTAMVVFAVGIGIAHMRGDRDWRV
jgi:hypothetical protein